MRVNIINWIYPSSFKPLTVDFVRKDPKRFIIILKPWSASFSLNLEILSRLIIKSGDKSLLDGALVRSGNY